MGYTTNVNWDLRQEIITFFCVYVEYTPDRQHFYDGALIYNKRLSKRVAYAACTVEFMGLRSGIAFSSRAREAWNRFAVSSRNWRRRSYAVIESLSILWLIYFMIN